jgi:hypothetical protein
MPININATACFRHDRAVARMDRRELAKARANAPIEAARAPFPCSLICTDCGALSDPVAVDPHRGLDGTRGPCPHCRHTAWADLANDDTAHAVAEGEGYEGDRDRPARRITFVVLRLAVALALSVACVHALVAAQTYSILFTMLTSLFCVLFVPALLITAGRELAQSRRRLPFRWALALPPATPQARAPAFTGPATPNGEPLHAPISGRPCIAYEVRVRKAGAGVGTPAALVEQRCTDLVVEGQEIPGARTLLRVPANALTTARLEATDVWLRSRGLLSTHGPWAVSETIIEPGQRVRAVPAVGGGAILMEAL